MADSDDPNRGSSVGRLIRYILSFIPPPPSDSEPRGEAIPSSGRFPVITSSTNPLYDSYYRHLSVMGHGIPIWIPEPNENLGIDYRKQGASIGDVVIFTRDGALDFLFNICLPANHAINSGGVPDGFTPFAPELTSRDMRRYQQYGEDSYLASKSITKTMGGMLPSGVLFTSSALEGAILTMPEGAYSEELTRVSGFHQYLSDNLATWYKYVNEDRQWGVEMGELHLVTGVHKASAWGIATFQFAEETTTVDVNLQLKAKDNHPYGTMYSWEYSGVTDSPRTGPTTKQLQSLFRCLPEEERGHPFENQSLFVRTVNSAIREPQEMRGFRANSMVDRVHAGTQTHVSGSSGVHIGSNGTASAPKSGENNRSFRGGLNTSHNLSIVQNGPAPREHPSKAINDFLLREKPNGRIAITNDQHWISLLTENDIVLPTGDEFLARLTKSYRIIEDKGIISLESVTADLPRPSITLNVPQAEQQQIDFFGELIDWFAPSSASSNVSSHNLFNAGKVSSDPARPRAVVAKPFGNGVTFDNPTQLSMLSLPELNNTTSVFELIDDTTTATEPPRLEFTLSRESLRLSSHYSSEVFNVLQTYRGLPSFENLVPDTGEAENTTVIRLSLAADRSATPRDDPRFVIWGESIPEYEIEDYHSNSKDRAADNPPAINYSSSISKRRGSKASRLASPKGSSSNLPPPPPPPPPSQRVLLAATIERWIAQLTSDLNYDELLNFFLTYRTYISAVDLCHLFICRFHWALQPPSSSQDERVRRIVRVRTFVAIRYWFVTFFTVDFIPNRELRLLMSDWLNTLLEDPILKRHSDAVGIVQRLIKVAKDCKRAHTRATEKPKPSTRQRVPEEKPAEHVLGKSFAEAIRKPPVPEDDASVLDLDFLPDEAKVDKTSSDLPSDPANVHLTAVLSGNIPTSLPLSSLNILQRTGHALGPTNDEEVRYYQDGTVQLGTKHSTLSRAFVRTIGRLGRWKRALNPRPRPTTIAAACGVGVSPFDLDITAPQDLLSRNGGIEQFPKMTQYVVKSPPAPVITIAPTVAPVRFLTPPIPPVSTTPPLVPPLQSLHQVIDATYTTEHAALLSVSDPETSSNAIIEDRLESVIPIAAVDEPHTVYYIPPTSEDIELEAGQPTFVDDEVNRLREPGRAQSLRSSTSTDSFSEPLTSDGPLPPVFLDQHNQWPFEVISTSNFSDTSSLTAEDPSYPPGLRKAPKTLPNRSDFEFVRRSEIPSTGIVSHESIRDSVTSSSLSITSPTSSEFQQWELKSLRQTFESLSNDEEDSGDMETALRRLEGHIDPKVQQGKAEKVDGWFLTLQERIASGEYEYDDSSFAEEVESFFDELPNSTTEDEAGERLDVAISSDINSYDHFQEDSGVGTHTPIVAQADHQPIPTPPGLETFSHSGNSKPAVEDVPLEIPQSRVTPSLGTSALAAVSNSIDNVLTSQFVSFERHHRSFILDYPSELLAQQFSMIDRELFMVIKFEELVSEDWIDCEEITVLDWAQYLKDRARWKVEGRFAEKTTALVALRARFNLMVSFVISEIVLTAPSDRHIVVSKFIRIAWKSYSLSNFHTLTAIITALQNGWVNRAMRKSWSKIGGYEDRMFRDLKQFTSNAGDFKFMRKFVDSIMDSKPLEGSHHAASVVSVGDSQNGKGRSGSDNRPIIPSACIPFIGIYLSQLRRHKKLPALIDPTTPSNAIGIDPDTAIFDPPAHPEVFSNLKPLPPSMHLEPLINVHKQRRIANVIKSFVAGQHLASRIQFDVNKKLFQRCLRLGALDPQTLQRALVIHQD